MRKRGIIKQESIKLVDKVIEIITNESSIVWDSEHRKRHKVSEYVGKVIIGDIENSKKIRKIVSIYSISEIDHL